MTELARRVRRFYAYTGGSSFALWIPFWTLWIRGNLGSDFEFTLVDVAFWLGMLASQLPVGVLADRIGRRRTIVLREAIRSAGILGYEPRDDVCRLRAIRAQAYSDWLCSRMNCGR